MSPGKMRSLGKHGQCATPVSIYSAVVDFIASLTLLSKHVSRGSVSELLFYCSTGGLTPHNRKKACNSSKTTKDHVNFHTTLSRQSRSSISISIFDPDNFGPSKGPGRKNKSI